MFDNIYLDTIFGLDKEAGYSKRNQKRKMVEKMRDRVVPALNGPAGSEMGMIGPVAPARTAAPALNGPAGSEMGRIGPVAPARTAAPAVAPSVLPTRERAAVAKAAKGGMSLAAKLGIGGLAAAGLAGGAYYAMNDGHHAKRASAIEGLVLAGYSVEQALQILEG